MMPFWLILKFSQEGTMEIPQERKHLCVVCQKNAITETRVETTCEGYIPDQSNCDLSTYSGHGVVGGKLLKNRTRIPWIQVSAHSEATSVGGICDECLQTPVVDSLIPHLNLVG